MPCIRSSNDPQAYAPSVLSGGVDSQLLRNLHPAIAWIVKRVRIYPVSLGVITSLYAATSDAALDMNGEVSTGLCTRRITLTVHFAVLDCLGTTAGAQQARAESGGSSTVVGMVRGASGWILKGRSHPWPGPSSKTSGVRYDRPTRACGCVCETATVPGLFISALFLLSGHYSPGAPPASSIR